MTDVRRGPPHLARTFARWATDLGIGDLPPIALEKVRSLLLHHLVGVVFAFERERTRSTIALVRAEEEHPAGARILGDDLGARVSRQGAVLANAEILNLARLNDSFRMITHPGPVLIATAIANAELEGSRPADLFAALACGYEFECRLADRFVPSVSARGFRPAPIFSTMGAAMVAGKLFRLDEDGLVATIGLAANCAAGLNESRRDAETGGNENSMHQFGAARQGTFAAVLARTGRFRGSEAILEGPAGFFASFAGTRDGYHSYVFTGSREVDYPQIVAGLGEDYLFRHVMFRIYPVSGFDQPIIDLVLEMRDRHGIDSRNVEEMVVTTNVLETLYPSPEFPRNPDPDLARVGSIQFFAAEALLNGGVSVVGGRSFSPDGIDPKSDERILRFMRERVRVQGVEGWPMFSPEIAVTMSDGTIHTGSSPYERLEWSFDELVARLEACVPGLPGGRARMDRLIDLVTEFERLPTFDPIFEAVRCS